MHLVVVGVNHNTAPVELRERLAIDDNALAEALSKLTSNKHIEELCIISTCNRTELYAVTHAKTDDELLVAFLADYSGMPREQLEECIYITPGHHAIRHLFEVACGLDSMALGETQILGQIKNAFCIATDSETTGMMLNNLFRFALSAGKRARTETGISNGAFSIGAAAVELARFVFGNLKGRKALLLGAGKMSKLAATHLQSNGVEKIYIASRTMAKVEELVEDLGAEAIEIECYEEALEFVDVVISSTSSREPVITKELMARVMQKRSKAPIFLIDIAVPRDIEPGVAEIDGVFVYNIDDLQFLVDKCRSERLVEAEKVSAIIDEETTEFMSYLRTLEAVPLIKQLREKFDSVYAAEWEKCSIKLSHLSDADKESVRRAIKSAVTKLTHDPILRIKDYAANDGNHKLEIVQDLFGLNPLPTRQPPKANS